MSEFQHKFAHSNGIQMHYVEAGSGPLVILCHGFPELWYSWRHQLKALAEAGFRAIAPDQRGYGDTEVPAEKESYSLCHLAGDIVGLLYDLGETNAIIVGHDWGSAVAWTSALLRPDLFAGVAMLSVPYLPNLWGGRRPTDAMRAMVGDTLNFYQLYFQQEGVVEKELEQDVERSLLAMYYSESAAANPDHRSGALFKRSERFIDTLHVPEARPSWLEHGDLKYYTKQFAKSGFRGPVNWYRNLDRNSELLGFLKNSKIEQPSIFIAGEKDGVIQLYRDAYEGLEKSAPGLRHKTLIPDAGHWVQQEQAKAVNRLLVDFCSSLRTRNAVEITKPAGL